MKICLDPDPGLENGRIRDKNIPDTQHWLQIRKLHIVPGGESISPEGPGPVHDEDPGAAGHQGEHAQDHGHHFQE
jgi:hypothetical protein